MAKLSYENLRKYCYFACLSDSALEVISKKLQHADFPEGTEIIKEGSPAEYFYLIIKGEVEISKKTKWGQTAKINVVGEGNGFGEMAFLTCSPRSCSVKAKTAVSLLKLHKKDFKEIVNMDSVFSKITRKRIKMYSYFHQLKTLQPFALLDPEKMDAITDKLLEKKYAPGEDIIVQGEKGDTYFIVKSGKANILKKMFTDEPEHVATLEEGDGFGEEALITNSRRSATVKAVNETLVWTLLKSDFDSVMASSFLEEVDPEDVLSEKSVHSNYLDVRMQMEFDEEHIPDAINIPLDELRDRYSELDPSREYYVYCLVGSRSASATFLMNSQGFKAKNIKGGIINWPGPVEEGTDVVHTPFKPT